MYNFVYTCAWIYILGISDTIDHRTIAMVASLTRDCCSNNNILALQECDD